MKAISTSLTTGKMHCIGKEESQASYDVSQVVLDSLTVNLRMEGVLVREELSFKWHCEEGLVENIERAVQVTLIFFNV